MLDRERLKRKVAVELLGHPVTLWPGIIGVGGLASAVAFPFAGAIPAFVGVAGLLTSAGALALRVLYRRQVILEKAMSDLEKEAEQAREGALDDLHRDLQEDGDPRTEQLLTDLRELTAMARDDQVWPDITANVKFDILGGVDKLFDASVERLRLTLTLYQRAGRLGLVEAREPILTQRERLIQQVAISIQELSRILTDIQALGVEEVDESDLRRILDDLDRSVEAERETRQTLDREIAKLDGQRQAAAKRQPT